MSGNKNNLILKRTSVVSVILIVLFTISNSGFLNEESRKNNTPKKLEYILKKTPRNITLNLWNAEFYDAAVIVQPLIGNLVFYSNFGKYEPRLASSWEQTKPNQWIFNLKEGFICENGEKITANSFKKSLEKSIYHLSQKNETPIFNKLVGYKEFLKNGHELNGIKTELNKIIFDFDSPVKDGLIQTLSFAPYGYICSENLNQNGDWKDNEKFISSGPYKVNKINVGKEYILEKRKEWNGNFIKKSPDQIRITHTIPDYINNINNYIIDSTLKLERTPSNSEKFKLVPEYLNAILLGNFKKGLFSNSKIRKTFKTALEYNRNTLLPVNFDNQIRSNTFLSNSKDQNNIPIKTSSIDNLKYKSTLVIEGFEPDRGSFKYFPWLVLKKTLDDFNLSYKFAENDSSWNSTRSLEYDIRLRSTSVGGSTDLWRIDMLFCSQIGPNYPNPSSSICPLLMQAEKQNMKIAEFEVKFLDIVDKDSSIIPISHLGNEFYLGSSIVKDSLSPLLNVIRFDQLEVD